MKTLVVEQPTTGNTKKIEAPKNSRLNRHDINLCIGISIFFDSPLERGDKGVCKFAKTHPLPLFLEGRVKVAAEGSLIKYLPATFSVLFKHRLS